MSFDEMMKQLRIEYVTELPQKISEIEKNLAAGDFTELQDNFHKLKGTGKTYGIPEISDLGAVVEKICKTSTEHAAKAVPTAIEILKEIHEQRAAEQEFNITGDQRFSELRTLV